MARGELKNSIQDLQFEWASNHPNKSVRDFLINVKGLTERQYRYIINQANLVEWKARREEIQNRVASGKIQNYAEEAAKVHSDFMMAAKLGLTKIMKALCSEAPLTSKDLLNLSKAMESNQTLFLRAMGVPEGTGLTQIYLDMRQPTNTAPAPQPTQQTTSKSPMEQLSYDEIKEFIDYRRELKRQRLAQQQTSPA